MKMRAALYCCDEADQATIEAQERELRLAASQRGWDVAEVFRDRVRKGYSVRHARDALCARLSMSPADFNIVMVWSISCLAGSLKDLVAIVGLFCSLDQQLFLMFQDVDTTESSGKSWLAAVAMLANFDRQKTIERVSNRVTFARNRSGKILNAKIDPELKARIEKDLRDGKIGQRKIAAKHCVGLGSVKKIKAEAAKNLRASVGLQEVFTAQFGGTAVSGETAQVEGREETPADPQVPSARNALSTWSSAQGAPNLSPQLKEQPTSSAVSRSVKVG
jgi:DNA invertase Pin-like site-specific DNA recombinase